MSTERAEQLCQEADVLRNQGQTEEALRLYREAADLFETAGEKIKAVDVGYLLVSTCLHMEGKREEAVKMGQEAARRFAELGAHDLEGSAYVNIGTANLNDDQLKKAEEWFKKALETLQALDSVIGQANFGIAHAKLGHTYAKEGRFDEAKHEFDEALEILRRVGHWFFEHTTLMHLAQMFFAQKDYQNALTYAQASLGLVYAENAIDEHARRVAELKGIIARCYWELGNEDWGIRFFQEAADLLNAMPDDVVHVVARNIRAAEFLDQVTARRPGDRTKLDLKALAR